MVVEIVKLIFHDACVGYFCNGNRCGGHFCGVDSCGGHLCSVDSCGGSGKVGCENNSNGSVCSFGCKKSYGDDIVKVIVWMRDGMMGQWFG